MSAPTPSIPLTALDVEYARFNAARTVSDSRPSQFAELQVGRLEVTVDPVRDDAYWNRVLGLEPDSLGDLDRALALLAERPSVRLDVDRADSVALAGPLRARGLSPVGSLVWLWAATPGTEEGAGPGRAPSAPVIRLGPEGRPRVRELLELEGPIDDGVWEVRAPLLCTDTFRAFAVEGPLGLSALATTWVGTGGAILGNAYTRPEERGRGLHAALLAARLDDAAHLGLEVVVTDVEPATSSLRNAVRAGFSVLCEQVLWERAAPS